jgi:hypothetical protein
MFMVIGLFFVVSWVVGFVRDSGEPEPDVRFT